VAASFVVKIESLVFDFVKEPLNITQVRIVPRFGVGIKHILSNSILNLAQLHQKVFGNQIKNTMIVKVHLGDGERLLESLEFSLGCQHSILILRGTSLLKWQTLTIKPSILDVIAAHRTSILPSVG
tara:strand:+ start:1083 stop:1460 length:378 start_codon:yes stop_codon:yes gene_type:complete